MATFTNQATLTYNNTQTLSNITTGQIVEHLVLEKMSLQQTYAAGDRITYVVTLVSSGTSDDTGITLTDDLGAGVPPAEKEAVYPLTYDPGSLLVYQNGVPQTAPQVTSEAPLTVTGIDVTAGGSTVIMYTAQVSGSAPLSVGSVITNTVTAEGGNLTEPLTDSHTLNVSEAPYLTVEKSLTPLTVTANQRVTYTFVINNYGNTAAEADANAVITDTLIPVLTGLDVTFNGTAWTENTEYTYSEQTGVFASEEGAITVPAAQFTTSPDGTVTSVPGTATLVIEGTIG